MINHRFTHFSIAIILIFIILGSGKLLAKKNYPQEERMLWSSLDIEIKLMKNLELELSQEMRYGKERSNLYQSLSDIGLNYKLFDFFKVGLFYRYRDLPEEDDCRNEIYTNLTFNWKLWGFKFSDRSRIHLKFKHNDDNIYNYRNKLTISYNISKALQPYISAELFYRFLYEKGDRLAQGRYGFGIEISPEEHHSLDIYFLREQEYNTNKAVHSNIIGIGFNLEL